MRTPEKLGIPGWEFRLVPGRTKIDFDPNKEMKNRKRHGYSLESAVYLLERLMMPWGTKDPHMVSDGFIINGEVRHMHMSVGDCGNVIHMVTTMRPDETVRVISFRPAKGKERDLFCQKTGYFKQTRETCLL